MVKGRKKFLKRFIASLAATSIIVTGIPGLWMDSAAAKNKAVDGAVKPAARVSVDEKGFDTKGRMVAYFGTPKIDGSVDEVWKSAVPVSPVISSGNTDTKASFKALWDDKALYILAEVKDSSLSAESGQVYSRDSIEVFVDENNDKTKEFGVGDVHFRVNYKNAQSADHGELDRFYTSTKVVKSGYIVEARIALNDIPANDKVLGFELQINDAKEGKRIATLNLFDKTGSAYADTGKFGNILLTGRADKAVSGLNPYDLLNLSASAETILLDRYTNGYVVKDLIDKSQKAASDKATTQSQIDDLYVQLQKAVKELKHSGLGFDEKECRQIPVEYKTTDNKMGSIERLDYSTNTYDSNNKKIEKYLNVYLSNGYDAKDKNKKYNVLYLIHGMGENQDTVFGGPGKNTEMMKILDNMIANGQLEPMIVVTPTWTVEGNSDMFGLVKNFHKELINDILPAVESKYNTYAASASTADLKAARAHRAFGGFSMGSGCTWYNYIYGIDYFKYYVPMSLYCLQDVKDLGFEGTSSEQMAKYLASIPKEKGYGPKDFYIFCATGSDDMAYSGMATQVDAMKKLKDTFVYTADTSKGNFYFLALEGGTHTWNCVNRYLYNILPDLFQDKVSPTQVDKTGLNSKGSMLAGFGTPVVDGDVDALWDSAPAVIPKNVSGKTDASATFKALWDDKALYLLAEVKDKNISVESNTPYMQDSMEIFLDENNDKTQEYGIDDLHLRVNCENAQSVDTGNADRFFTSTKKTSDGYIIESRIALKDVPANGKVLGIELQINDARAADRVGAINVFDSTGTAWNDTSKFGTITLAGKKDGAVSGLNPYDLKNLIKSINKLDSKLYKNFSALASTVKAAEAVSEDKNVTQSKIDAQYAAIKNAMNKLVLTEAAANEKYFEAVPDEYRQSSKKQGTVESIKYDAANLTKGTDVKYMNVYLPYGYNPADASKKYNVLYLMHGGGENENTILGGPGQNKELKKILDNMIENGDIEPLIVVTPSTYKGKNDTALFHEELVNTIIPLVETKYHTYAGTASKEDLKASRGHRAFGGFSMGSVTTWYTYINCLDYFKYFMPLSGDSWVLGQGAGSSKAKETAEYLAKVAKDSGYKPTDYYIFSATGSLDIAYANLKPQVDAMKQLKDSFIYSSDMKKGNFYFIVADGGTHAWNWVNQYVYDILPDLLLA
ncbi:MAG: Carbohydrate-binding family 9 [Eubacterium sp.]|nr:Carbohydrate-binding family 9 [Eubacterium sp.]